MKKTEGKKRKRDGKDKEGEVGRKREGRIKGKKNQRIELPPTGIVGKNFKLLST